MQRRSTPTPIPCRNAWCAGYASGVTANLRKVTEGQKNFGPRLPCPPKVLKTSRILSRASHLTTNRYAVDVSRYIPSTRCPFRGSRRASGSQRDVETQTDRDGEEHVNGTRGYTLQAYLGGQSSHTLEAGVDSPRNRTGAGHEKKGCGA